MAWLVLIETGATPLFVAPEQTRALVTAAPGAARRFRSHLTAELYADKWNASAQTLGFADSGQDVAFIVDAEEFV